MCRLGSSKVEPLADLDPPGQRGARSQARHLRRRARRLGEPSQHGGQVAPTYAAYASGRLGGCADEVQAVTEAWHSEQSPWLACSELSRGGGSIGVNGRGPSLGLLVLLQHVFEPEMRPNPMGTELKSMKSHSSLTCRGHVRPPEAGSLLALWHASMSPEAVCRGGGGAAVSFGTGMLED